MVERKEVRKRKLKKEGYLALFILLIIIVGAFLLIQKFNSSESTVAEPATEHVSKPEVEPVTKNVPVIEETSITVSAAGDFTLGTDESFSYHGSFVHEADESGLSHFVGGLNEIFKEDDFTTVNLETTLTTATQKANKKFRFKGNPEYAKILSLGGIEAVNLANNHIFDYLEQGYQDTMGNLEKENIGYFGYENKYITTIKDVKIGSLGYEGWRDTEEIRSQIEKDIQSLKDEGVQIILVHFHWGVERAYEPLESQRTLAQFTIDSGADLILGHHPHVVQGIEEYNGKFIVYSLGNFMFGGNRNPSDKDTFVFQQTFYLENGELTDEKEIRIVPFSISSVDHRNDYRPTMLTGEAKTRVKDKIVDVSDRINGTDWLVYEKDENGNIASVE